MESEAGMENRTPLGTLTPSQQNGENGALDFSKLTPSQFGITPNSFTAFPKDKDKSRVAQLKARRRSTIGVRGSPETNSLICFRAKQAMKTPPRTPPHLLESPLFSGRDSIKQKMAAFQRLMGTDEENTGRSASLMKEGKEEEEEEGARHTQSDADGGSEERENRLAPVTPPQPKRRRRGTPHRGLWEEQIEEEEPLSELTHTPKHEQQVEFKSPKMAPSLGLGLSLGLDSQSQLMSLPMLSKPELIKTGDVEVSSVSKRKRVRFGAPLSPEFFDKTLPPSTPLQKGATPSRPPSSTGRKHSLLKTPQRFEPPLPQPDFSSPVRSAASPVLTTHTYSDGGLDSDEVFLDNQKISFPNMDEEFDNPPVDSKASAEISELTAHHEPLAKDAEITDTAFEEEEEETRLSFAATPDPPAHPPTAEPELNTEQGDRLRPLKTAESSAEAPRSRGRKRKQPAESETTETRRSSRSAAVSAKGKLKTSSAKKRFGTKEVDRSLYGKRDYASKNPLLSPIIESAASSLSSTPTQPRTGENPDSSPAPAPSTKQSKTASSGTTADLVAAAALWRSRFLHQAKNSDSDSNLTDESERSVLTDAPVQSEASVESSVVPAGRRASTGRAGRGRRNSASRRRSWSDPKAKDEREVREQKTEVHQSESHESIQEEDPAGEQSISEKLNRRTERKSEPKTPSGGRQRGRKSARTKNSSVAEEEEEQLEERRGLEKTCQETVESSGSEKEEVEKNDEDGRQTSGHEVEEKNNEDGRQTSGHEVEEKKDEDSNPSLAPLENLEPWQQPDFCIEDVLKPVAKSRGSVRRSLRHRRSMDVLAKGLAWVEHTSPQMITTNQRRRTRGRLSAVSQPPPFPDSEETPTNQ
ncbi:cell division cycle-associated protein 2 isoform X1 [Pangasianodon hypophthalmus]|uniref:cell division cycle-associated protein 2 isoform X1 n=1 Tax=Pangasianodon hypophthalmus TaxID=310915 RepID=UPI002307BC79|nr:cell division cycle-associated protein 2 isoform X1 [Pangasianodon hypophthalmus]XP_034154756.2 cell division cycle-associated protein 2 isoform X1 [Pangasianodon hypophthalmus]